MQIVITIVFLEQKMEIKTGDIKSRLGYIGIYVKKGLGRALEKWEIRMNKRNAKATKDFK